jgi:effector-binding domain-containing protein
MRRLASLAKEGPLATHAVKLTTLEARPTAVVAQATTWQEFPTLWGRLLEQVYTLVRAVEVPGAEEPAKPRWQNVMLYKDDVPNVEVGVLVGEPILPSGRVIASVLPAGAVAMTLHRGPYSGLDRAHRAVLDWCAQEGHTLAGTRWEIYGHWREDPRELETEVYYLLG